ncbi:zinc-ribbon domain-containing protein [Rossellomorea aquimaris]|uniref:zinc-ribbon domain-containing protein n=1 Tax=Rossellomorea aquimaris TaxID=189382 RepID=UPI0007D06235|nr:zinc-ribbon domain-containing protein [Rossellomorea aquimaris]
MVRKKLSKNLIKEWNWEKNVGLNPHDLDVLAKAKLWWLCEQGHEWEARLDHRERGSNCPYCSGFLLALENSLAFNHPNVAEEWNYEKNNIKPEEVSKATTKVYWWICKKKKHQWRASVANRTRRGDKCPYCSGKKATEENCLNTLRSELAKEWNFKQNGSLTPNDVTLMSNKKVWWICEKGCEWEDKVCARVTGNRCSVCYPRVSPQKVSEKYNFKTMSPELMIEWHPLKNQSIDPSKISPVSGKKVWWKCQVCTHEWEASIDNRKKGRACPKCNYGHGTSFQEQCFFYYLSKIFPNCKNKFKMRIDGKKVEVDLYLNDNFGIEYDGYFSHLERGKKDEQKNKELQHLLKLIRIRENNGPNKKLPTIKTYGSTEFQCNANKQIDIALVMKRILETIGTLDVEAALAVMDINVKRDALTIQTSTIKQHKERSLAHLYPHIAKEWDEEKNGGLSATNVLPGSVLRVHWKCSDCSEEWDAIVNKRVNGQTCPFCSGNKAGHVRSLKSDNPLMASMWHPSKNGSLTPNQVFPGSKVEAWWFCSKCKQDWKEPIGRRTSKKGCPYCDGSRVYAGNCLATIRPDIAKLWDITKNDFCPQEVTASSGKDAHWCCFICRQQWREPIYRMSKKKGCPYCNNYRAYEGNSLAAIKPQIALLWHPTKNNLTTPKDVTSTTTRNAWWLCTCGKDFEQRINKMKINSCSCKI